MTCLFGIKSYSRVDIWNTGTEAVFQTAKAVSLLSFKWTLPSTFNWKLTNLPHYLYSGLCYGQIVCVSRIQILRLPVGASMKRNSVA